ncbi:hypothetical protein BKA64DRAFT_580453, partial [Cadophora sp. MPI-SDFR-AT-0126]
KGLEGVVVGTANTAHNIAEDMLSAEMNQVTMVQRNKTFVLPIEYNTKVMEIIYNNYMPTEVADRLYFFLLYGIVSVISKLINYKSARAELECFKVLEKVGFNMK